LDKKWGLDIFLENVWEMGSAIWVRAYVRYLKKVGIKVVYVHEPHYAQDE